MSFTDVTRAQLEEWLLVNPGLERDCCGIAEPPIVTYNEFSSGKKWPESIVASYRLGHGPGDPLHDFKIRSDLLDSVWCSGWTKK